MPPSQLQRNWDTYEELLSRGMPEDLPIQWQGFPRVAMKLVLQKMQTKTKKRLDELEESLLNLSVAYLNFDTSILVWGDFQQHQNALFAVQNGLQVKLPYQVETGFCQLMLAVLHHTRDEVSTFWVVSSLVENYELRQFYQRGMPGVTVYGEVFLILVEQFLPQVAETLRRQRISYLDFFEEWASSLLTSEIPLDLTLQVLTSFLKDGWAYFFRLSLSVLHCLKHQIVTIDANMEIGNKRERLLALLHFQEQAKTSNEEDFAVDDDDKKEFDANFAIIDSRIRKVSHDIVDHKKEMVTDPKAASEEEGISGFFKNVMNFFGQQDTPTKPLKTELKRIQNLINRPYNLSVHDFIAEPHATWDLVLDLAQYQWLSGEKREQLLFMKEDEVAELVYPLKAADLPTLSDSADFGCLKPSEHQGDYEVNRDLVVHLLEQTHSLALQKFLALQQPEPAVEGDKMPEAFGELAGDDRPPDLTSCKRGSIDSRFQQSVGNHLQPPTSRKGEGPSIVQFDALSVSKNDGGHFAAKKGSNKPSRHGSQISHHGIGQPRASVQSNSAYGVITANQRRDTDSDSQARGSLGKKMSRVGDKSFPMTGVSQIGHTAMQQSYFNEADMSMMEEVNKLLSGLGDIKNKRGSVNSWRSGANQRRSIHQEDAVNFGIARGSQGEFAAMTRNTRVKNALVKKDDSGSNGGTAKNFERNIELGKTMENISKIEGVPDQDNSEFLASYMGKEEAQKLRKEQRAFHIATPGTPGGVMSTAGRDSAAGDCNIRDHSAMSHSDRKNVQAMNFRQQQQQPAQISRFDATEDYTDLRSMEYDEQYTPNQRNKKGSQNPFTAAARPSATMGRDRTKERQIVHKVKARRPEEDSTLIIVNATNFEEEEENFNLQENDFEREHNKKYSTVSSANKSNSLGPGQFRNPSSNCSAATGGFGGESKLSGSSQNKMKLHNMPMANKKKAYLAANNNNFNSFASERNMPGAMRSTLGSSSASSLLQLQSKQMLVAHQSMQTSGLQGTPPGKSAKSIKSGASQKHLNKPHKIATVSPMSLLMGKPKKSQKINKQTFCEKPNRVDAVKSTPPPSKENENLYTLAKKTSPFKGLNQRANARNIVSPQFGRPGESELAFKSPQALEKLQEAAFRPPTEHQDESDRGRGQLTGFKGSERDETPDVLGPGRGVGNLFTKLVDCNGSFPMLEEQNSLQNPGQLLKSPKREIKQIMVLPAKDSDQSHSVVQLDASTHLSKVSHPKGQQSKSSVQRSAVIDNQSRLQKSIDHALNESKKSAQLNETRKSQQKSLKQSLQQSIQEESKQKTSKKLSRTGKSFKSFRSQRSKERSLIRSQAAASMSRQAAAMEVPNLPQSPDYVGKKAVRALSPSATRPLDLSALQAQEQGRRVNLNKTMLPVDTRDSSDNARALNKSHDIMAHKPKKKKLMPSKGGKRVSSRGNSHRGSKKEKSVKTKNIGLTMTQMLTSPTNTGKAKHSSRPSKASTSGSNAMFLSKSNLVDQEQKELDLSQLMHRQQMAEIEEGKHMGSMPNVTPIRNSSEVQRGRQPVSKRHAEIEEGGFVAVEKQRQTDQETYFEGLSALMPVNQSLKQSLRIDGNLISYIHQGPPGQDPNDMSSIRIFDNDFQEQPSKIEGNILSQLKLDEMRGSQGDPVFIRGSVENQMRGSGNKLNLHGVKDEPRGSGNYMLHGIKESPKAEVIRKEPVKKEPASPLNPRKSASQGARSNKQDLKQPEGSVEASLAKLKRVQDFISQAKKNKFSEWRKLKQQNQTVSSGHSHQNRF